MLANEKLAIAFHYNIKYDVFVCLFYDNKHFSKPMQWMMVLKHQFASK